MRILTLMLLFTSLAAAAVIENGDFESPAALEKASSVPGVWSVYTSGMATGKFSVEDAAGFNASRGAAFSRTQTNYENNHLDQVLTVEPKTFYRVSARVKSDGICNPVVAVLSMNWKVLGIISAGTDAAWRQVSFFFGSGTNTTVRFEWFPAAAGVLYSGGGAGSGALDDVTVEKIDDLSDDVKRTLSLTQPKPEEMNRSAVRTGPVGDAKPLRRIIATNGMLRYEDGGEVSLWGVNFQTMLSWEYNGLTKNAGIPLETEALKKITDASLDELVLMRTSVVRAHLLPGDFTDADGNLTNTIFLDQLDYFLAACRRRSITVYLTLINIMGGPNKTFVKESFAARWRERYDMIFGEDSAAKSERYVRALLTRTNPYTGTAYRDEPALGVIEIMNEPDYVVYKDLSANPGLAHQKALFERFCSGRSGIPELLFPEFRYNAVKEYITRMHAAIRSAGAAQPVIWNCNWPEFINGREDVFQAVADSPVDAVSFCFYPGQGDCRQPYWDYPTNLAGKNYFPKIADHYREYGKLRWLLTGRFAAKAKVVYEFETFYNQASYLYPAFARLFRSLGAQSATMWTYRMMPAAFYSGGSHYLNLLTTPEKAVSSIIAGEVMKRVPRYGSYDTDAKDDMRFGDFHLSFPENVSVFCDGTDLIYTRSVTSFPVPVPDTIKRITGTGSSPLVNYTGSGAYFISIGASTIDIDIMPEVTFTKPPWMRDKKPICSLDYVRTNPMTLKLNGWNEVTIEKTAGTNTGPVAISGPGVSFDASAGHYRIKRK